GSSALSVGRPELSGWRARRLSSRISLSKAETKLEETGRAQGQGMGTPSGRPGDRDRRGRTGRGEWRDGDRRPSPQQAATPLWALREAQPEVRRGRGPTPMEGDGS